MKKVSNLSELVYMMLMVARNNKVKELENDLEDMNDTDMMSVADLKGRLE